MEVLRMGEAPKPDELGVSYRSETNQIKTSTFSKTISYLVFQAHGVRVGLELSLCVIVYALTTALIPWQLLGVPEKWSVIICWFGSCFGIIVFDQLVLCRAAFNLKRAYLLNLNGEHQDALDALDEVGPQTERRITLPQDLYHLQRAEIFTSQKDYDKAYAELQLAEFAGADEYRIRLVRSSTYSEQSDFVQAHAEIQALMDIHGETAVLKLEQALLHFRQREDLWMCKSLFKEILELPDAAHFAGESTRQIALAYYNACRLFTGEAEEGLIGISDSIDRFRSAILYVDSLRPVVSELLLERAYYQATHKEPQAAFLDHKVAMSLCKKSSFCQRSEEIKEELAWRHEMEI
jgi:hypothetical protein